MHPPNHLLKVTAYVCYSVVPVFFVYALQALIFDIYFARITSSIVDENALLAANLADLLLDGICRLAINGVLILTMSLPGVQWTQASSHPGSHGEWPNSKYEESQAAFSITPYQQQPAPLYPQQSHHQQPQLNHPQQQPYQQQPYQQQPYYTQYPQ